MKKETKNEAQFYGSEADLVESYLEKLPKGETYFDRQGYGYGVFDIYIKDEKGNGRSVEFKFSMGIDLNLNELSAVQLTNLEYMLRNGKPCSIVVGHKHYWKEYHNDEITEYYDKFRRNIVSYSKEMEKKSEEKLGVKNDNKTEEKSVNKFCPIADHEGVAYFVGKTPEEVYNFIEKEALHPKNYKHGTDKSFKIYGKFYFINRDGINFLRKKEGYKRLSIKKNGELKRWDKRDLKALMSLNLLLNKASLPREYPIIYYHYEKYTKKGDSELEEQIGKLEKEINEILKRISDKSSLSSEIYSNFWGWLINMSMFGQTEKPEGPITRKQKILLWQTLLFSIPRLRKNAEDKDYGQSKYGEEIRYFIWLNQLPFLKGADKDEIAKANKDLFKK